MPPQLSVIAGETSLRVLASIIDRRSRGSGHRGGVVLMYHDVVNAGDISCQRVVPPLGADLLRAELEHLQGTYDVVSIHELRARVAARAPGERFPVSLTFDDDLESHLTIAAPLLCEFELPATFFLTGSSLKGPSAFWWHDLDELFARGGESWRAVCREVNRRWGLVGDDVDLPVLARTVETLRPDQRDAFAYRLREIAASPPQDRGLSEHAVRHLVELGFEIGFHTSGHYLLQTLDDQELYAAMREGTDTLAAVVGRPLRAIAYPHCRPADLRLAAAAAEAGFELGFVCNDQPVAVSTNRLLLDRVDGWRPSVGSLAFRLARVLSAAA